MPKSFIAAIAAALVATAATAAEHGLRDGRYTVDPSHSYAHFRIGHMGLSAMQGRVDVAGGVLVLDTANGNSRVAVTLDPATVDTGQAERDKKLRNLKGFFNVDKYPTIRFVSTDIRFGKKPGRARVRGRLTLHGVTRPITLAVRDMACRTNPLETEVYTCGFDAVTKLRRSTFGMDAFSEVVGDTVVLRLELEADRPLASEPNGAAPGAA